MVRMGRDAGSSMYIVLVSVGYSIRDIMNIGLVWVSCKTESLGAQVEGSGNSAES